MTALLLKKKVRSLILQMSDKTKLRRFVNSEVEFIGTRLQVSGCQVGRENVAQNKLINRDQIIYSRIGTGRRVLVCAKNIHLDEVPLRFDDPLGGMGDDFNRYWNEIAIRGGPVFMLFVGFS